MRGFAKATVVGNVGKDPEIRYTQQGTPVANFSVACNETWKDKNGEKQERTEWVNTTVFGKLAEIVRDYVTKGAPIYLEGKIQTDEWEDRDGNKRRTTKVIVDGFNGKILLLGGKPQDGDRTEGARRATEAYMKREGQAQGEFQASDDDVPF